MKKQIVMTFILLLFSSLSWADQCSKLPKDKALKAQKIISTFIKTNEIAVIDLYCQACMFTYPEPIVADSVSLKDFQVKGYKEILVNNVSIDLAYVYINGENVANIIGCKTVGVDKFL